MSKPQSKTGPPPTRRGYDAHEVVSALQKAIRRSDPDAALYWSFELAKSGYGAWLFARLKIIAIEDVGPEATGLVADLHALADQYAATERKRKGSGALHVARAAISLATAPKSRVVDWAAWHHNNDHVERREIPDEARDTHTRAGRRMGRGLEHFLAEASRLIPYQGDLAELEAEYRQLAERRVAKDPTLPSNPWSAQEPAHNSAEAHLGQLSGGAQLPIRYDQEDR